MPPVEFEPTIPASARPQTYALDRAATGIGVKAIILDNNIERLGATLVCELPGWTWEPAKKGIIFRK
jgi:hypothetical protein